jgi:hypothetical protein
VVGRNGEKRRETKPKPERQTEIAFALQQEEATLHGPLGYLMNTQSEQYVQHPFKAVGTLQ